MPANVAFHFLTHPLLLPADGLQVATGRFQVRVPEPQLHRPDVNSGQQVHAREGLAELFARSVCEKGKVRAALLRVTLAKAHLECKPILQPICCSIAIRRYPSNSYGVIRRRTCILYA
jgi:hypothetical protein